MMRIISFFAVLMSPRGLLHLILKASNENCGAWDLEGIKAHKGNDRLDEERNPSFSKQQFDLEMIRAQINSQQFSPQKHKKC